MSTNLYNLKELKGFEHDKILHDIYHANYFYSATYNQLAKHFLSYFLTDIFQRSFEDIRTAVISQVNDPSIYPKAEVAFYQFICKTHLDLERLPAAVMLQYYGEAMIDLQTIDNRLKEHERLAEEINAKEPSQKTEQDTYQIRILNHYHQANSNAKEEIMRFLFYKIKDYTLFNSTLRPWITTLFYAGIPYSFRVLSKHLQWESLSDLSNKFNDLPIDEHRRLQGLYNATDKSEFYGEVRQYISSHNIIDKIKGMIAGNHRLDQRSRVFTETFEAYDRGSKYIFCSVIALQIEGLFSDYCLELEIDETSIRSGSLTDKVRMAATKNRRYRNFEYYAFRFPLIRNQVAHGNLIKDDVDDLADYLILDLFDVCLSLTSLTLPVNKVVSIIRQWSHSKTHKYAVRYALYREKIVPPFYKLEDTIVEIKESIVDRSFWDYLLHLSEQDAAMLRKGILKIVLSLKKSAINVPWCNELIGKLPGVTVDGFDEDQFLEELNSALDLP